MELALKDRLSLRNQYRILEVLNPDEAEHFQRLQRILERGFTSHYGEMTEDFESAPLASADFKRVMDILDMYDAMQFAGNDLQGIDTAKLVFPGFDKNNERRELAYTKFLTEDSNSRWTTLNVSGIVNAHWPTRAIYDAMLVEWEKSADKHKLTKDDLVRMLAAQGHSL